MFTGIVAAVGQIKKIEPFDNNGGVRLQIDSGGCLWTMWLSVIRLRSMAPV